MEKEKTIIEQLDELRKINAHHEKRKIELLKTIDDITAVLKNEKKLKEMYYKSEWAMKDHYESLKMKNKSLENKLSIMNGEIDALNSKLGKLLNNIKALKKATKDQSKDYVNLFKQMKSDRFKFWKAY